MPLITVMEERQEDVILLMMLENYTKFKNGLDPSWNVFEIKYKYLEDLSDLKSMRLGNQLLYKA